MAEYKLELRGVCKSFPGVKALDNVQLSLRPGTVHALMGENGAGKSTLMKCLFGIYKMDAGEIILDGEKVEINNPDEAMKKGIAMVHQELQPVPARSVAENMYLGRFPTKCGPLKVIDHKKMYEDTAKWLKEVKMDFDPKAQLGSLSIGQMQSVEIAKAVSQQAKVIIFDEPTSSLSDNEVEALFRIMNDLRDKGVAMVYISHKMDEIKRIADDITVMRDGTYVGTWPAAEMTTDQIITKMVGRELTNVYPPRENKPGDEVVMEVKNLCSIHAKSFQNVSFQLHKGEILGFGGLVGAQRTELMEGIFGIRGIASGEIYMHGKKVKIKHPIDAMNAGIGLITEDRRGNGIFGCLSIKDNVGVFARTSNSVRSDRPVNGQFFIEEAVTRGVNIEKTLAEERADFLVRTVTDSFTFGRHKGTVNHHRAHVVADSTHGQGHVDTVTSTARCAYRRHINAGRFLH